VSAVSTGNHRVDRDAVLALYLVAFVPATIGAQEADPCAGLAGSALAQCQSNRQKLQRQQLAEQQRQLAQQQQQLAQQQQQLMRQQRKRPAGAV
jgi:hypothetical protein